MGETDKYGTIVKVPLHTDVISFKRLVLETTAYFPNVVYNFDYSNLSAEQLNDYSFIQFDNFIIRVQNKAVADCKIYDVLETPHIVCNNVWYKVNERETNIDPAFSGMIGLKGDLNSISLVRSREELLYKENTVAEVQRVSHKANIEFYKKIFKPNCSKDYSDYMEYLQHKEDRITIRSNKKSTDIIFLKNKIKGTFMGVKAKTFTCRDFYDTHNYVDNKKTGQSFYNCVLAIREKKNVLSSKTLDRVKLLVKKKVNIFQVSGLTVPQFIKARDSLLKSINVIPFSELPDAKKKVKEATKYYEDIDHNVISLEEGKTYYRINYKLPTEIYKMLYPEIVDGSKNIVLLRSAAKLSKILDFQIDEHGLAFIYKTCKLIDYQRFPYGIEIVSKIRRAAYERYKELKHFHIPDEISPLYKKQHIKLKKSITYIASAIGSIPNGYNCRGIRDPEKFQYLLAYELKKDGKSKDHPALKKQFIFHFNFIKQWLQCDN